MSYELRYSDKARARIAELSPDLTAGVEAAFLRLAASPTTHSVRIASPPYAPRGQLYHFELDDPAGTRWFFTVIFQFSQDETALWVITLTRTELDPD